MMSAAIGFPGVWVNVRQEQLISILKNEAYSYE